jgi:N-acetylated-alpha-linked acidic dipeptidase
MSQRLLFVLALAVLIGAPLAGADDERQAHSPPLGWTPDTWKAELAYEEALLPLPQADFFARFHERICARPHPAGTELDDWMEGVLKQSFEELQVPYEVHEIWPYLPRFVDAKLELIAGDKTEVLPIREYPVNQDAAAFEAFMKEVGPGWNAYSGSGTVTGEVIYVNQGTQQDFAWLAAKGRSCKGKIVIARYGGNYRGYKAKFAEEAGAIGLIMYTDPADSGWSRGLSWPEGGYANESSIQRGSIITLPWGGDPLTPGAPATKDARRLDPATIALPTIPVQCIGWGSATRILSRMRGDEVHSQWQGGLPFRYRIDQGDAPFRVRLTVKQDRVVRRTANVIGVVKGRTHPDEWVVVGCHRDAWTFGAGDPHAGTIILYALAQAFAREARAGRPPSRTILFANWAAEEMGLLGSTEWCEAHADKLRKNAVAYLNLDMAAMGTRFRASGDAHLTRLLREVTPDMRARGPAGGARVRAGLGAEQDLGVMGGGSDHVGFYLHLGVPCFSIGAGGGKGVSYHSAHDHIPWYRKAVGTDYSGASMLSEFGKRAVARLANAPIIPIDPEGFLRIANDLMAKIEMKSPAGLGSGPPKDLHTYLSRLDAMRKQARKIRGHLEAPPREGWSAEVVAKVNEHLRALSRCFLLEEGLPARPWYRNGYAGVDPNSGYASWPWPELREGAETGDERLVAKALANISNALDRYEAKLAALDTLLAR